MKRTLEINQWFPYWQSKPQARLRLFCFPYAGGSASIFRLWSEQLPAEVDICPVQLPGRENRLREQPFMQINPLIEALSQAIQPFLDMPYAFFGHSMGALISYELACRLRDMKVPAGPVHLFVSAHRAPFLPDPDPPTYHLPENEFTAELRRLQGTPEEVLQNPELLLLVLPLLRADFSICETYTYNPKEPLSCPISAYGALYDTEVSRSEVAVWQECTTKAFKLQFFVGGHFYLHEELSSLLRVLTRDLMPYLR